MPLTTAELSAKMEEERLNPPPPTGTCKFCEKPCHGTQHEDCYFEAFGDHIEQHGLGVPHRVIRNRGAL